MSKGRNDSRSDEVTRGVEARMREMQSVSNVAALGVPGGGDQHRFVQFDGDVAVLDTRAQQNLADRAAVGMPLGPYGFEVASIVLSGGWFEIVTPTDTEMRVYRVPVSNVRSARR